MNGIQKKVKTLEESEEKMEIGEKRTFEKSFEDEIIRKKKKK